MCWRVIREGLTNRHRFSRKCALRKDVDVYWKTRPPLCSADSDRIKRLLPPRFHKRLPDASTGRDGAPAGRGNASAGRRLQHD